MNKETMKRFLTRLVKPSIIFESIPDFSDNTRAVYDEFVRRNYEKKYRLIWFIDDKRCASITGGKIQYWNPRERRTIAQKIRHYSFYFRTKCIVCCNRFLPSTGEQKKTYGEDQLCFYLSHGTPMKSVKGYYTSNGGIDYMLSPSKAMEELMANEFSVERSRVFSAGFPRNDVFARPAVDLRKKLGVSHAKIVVWYPTYRQNTAGTIIATRNALPIIHDEQRARQLNEFAKQSDILLILKPHFAQDVSLIRDLHLSHIRLINDDFFAEYDLTSYELLAGSDALVTDYSSVYFDYTLCDKPIGVVWEDIEEYSQFPGFALDLDYYLKGAVKIYTLEDFEVFLSDLANGNDRLQTQRREIRDVTNYSTDGNNAQRVVDFIVEKAGL